MNEPRWLLWARKLQTISQAGLTYSQDPVDLERFKEVRAVAAEITASHSNLTVEESLALFDRELVERAGEASPLETTAAEFFPLDALPPLRVPWMTEQVPHLFALHQDPHAPTEFD